MNQEEISKLSHVEKLIKVAELCGWSNVRKETNYEAVLKATGNHIVVGYKRLNDNKECMLERVPDYVNDLNAMYEAEESLDCMLLSYYLSRVMLLYGTDGYLGVHATAKQRAEVFILVKDANNHEEAHQ